MKVVAFFFIFLLLLPIAPALADCSGSRKSQTIEIEVEDKEKVEDKKKVEDEEKVENESESSNN